MTDTVAADRRTVLFPSAEAPGFPPFAIDCPASWRAESAPDCLMAVYDPASPPAFRRNVVVTADRVPTDVTLADVSQKLLETISTERDYTLLDQRAADVDGRPAVVRLSRFVVGDIGAEIVQLLVATSVVVAASTQVIYQVQGACLAAEGQHQLDILIGVARSFRLTDETHG